jgi:hypothetical protein
MILCEHWDDCLPIGLPQYHHKYRIEQVPVFNQDNEQKWRELNAKLQQADYYILSSNRAWSSMGRLPNKYPRMSGFYQDLFANKTNYKLVAKIHSHPSLSYLGLPITVDDSWAEEAFSVYDHPEVYVFKNMKE